MSQLRNTFGVINFIGLTPFLETCKNVLVMFLLPVMLLLFAQRAAAEQDSIDEYPVCGKCKTYDNVTYNVMGTIALSSNMYVDQLDYKFEPSVQVKSVRHADGKTIYFLVPPGAYTVTVSFRAALGELGVYKVTAPVCGPRPNKGVTWRFTRANTPTGTIRVGCATECDAYYGDTDCTEALPLLCIKKEGRGFPLPVPVSVDDSNRYSRWSGGIIGTTRPIVPPKKLRQANRICSRAFGKGWRVAEHHDGWGWGFQAYGGVGDPTKRFWIHINDEPDATCW